MNEWWKDPRLDDEGTYDYLIEELPQDSSIWSWYPSKCDDCGKERRWHRTDSHYFYCWDGWDCMDYTVCWKCHIKSVIHSSMLRMKKFIRDHIAKLDIGAYIVFRKFCKKHNIQKEIRKDMWTNYYDMWHDKAVYKILKGVR